MPPSAFLPAVHIGRWFGFPAVADFNGDGLLEPLGFLQNPDGTFSDAPSAYFSSVFAAYPGRGHRDNRILDIDGDGNLDVIWNVYTDPSITTSFTLIFYGDGLGGYTRYEERRDVNGFGETIVAADFNNDGALDVYLPVYTHGVGVDSAYLLLNEAGSLGANRASEWGASLAYLPGVYRVEGAHGADVNFDGYIDLYVGSHLFTNVGGTYFQATMLQPFVFDEGASLIDYDNDGDFDLVIRTSFTTTTAPQLFEWTGEGFEDRGLVGGDGIVGGFGLKVGDLDANGWQDIVFASSAGLTVLLNDAGVFTRMDTAMPVSVADTYALFDANGDGGLDVLMRSLPNLYLFENALDRHPAITFDLRGASGAQNQQGRSIMLVSTDYPSMRLARSIETGSGYMGQDQYVLSTGVPTDGAYLATIPFADLTITFTVSRGQAVTAYADGRLEIVGSDANDVMGGALSSDSLSGGDGEDVFIGSAGGDAIDGGNGVDRLDYSAFDRAVTADLAGDTVLTGDHTQSVENVEDVVGTRFGDMLIGNASANRLSGGQGNDIYVIGAGDVVVEAAGEGSDEVRTSLGVYTLADHVERLNGTASIDQQLTGNSLANSLSGGSGADVLRGLGGDDLYFVDVGDTVIEAAGEGADQVRTSLASYQLAENVETLVGLSNVGQELSGNPLANILSGAAGADTFRGGDGDDVYVVSTGDVVVEAAGQGIDLVQTALAAYVLPDNVENVLALGSAGQTLIGNALDNRFTAVASSGADIFRGGGGNDTYVVGVYDQVIEGANEGIDEVRTSLAFYTLPDHVENLVGLGSTSQKLTGNDLGNTIVAPTGFNFPYSGSLLSGLGGDDTYVISNSNDRIVTEALDGGYDTVRVSVNYQLVGASNIERLEAIDPLGTSPLFLGGGYADNVIIGNAGANLINGDAGGDHLEGLGGNDVLNGGVGADRMIGGTGNDEYLVDNTEDVVVELSGEGTDAVRTLSTYALMNGSHVEVLTTTSGYGATRIDLTGNEFAQTLWGNYGVNFLDGGGGADSMVGFGGDDEYYVDNLGDRIVEAAGEGFDSVRASASYVLQAGVHVEALTTTTGYGIADINLTGNEFAQTIWGNYGINILDGGAGSDAMHGFGGDDEYRIDSTGDGIVEIAGEGFDTARTSVSYALRSGVHIELFTTTNRNGTQAIILTGNELAQTIEGNEGNNILNGLGGTDAMSGFGGNDEYYVDNPNDIVVEMAEKGIDTVRASASYTLQASVHVEALTTTNSYGTASINLTGNEFAQTIWGNYGNNVLDGGGGADAMYGFGGNDEYRVDNSRDGIVEAAGEGHDTVRAAVSYVLRTGVHVETLTTTSGYGTGRIDLTGNGFAQTIWGNYGGNIIDGGGGADAMYGFGGDDEYRIDNAADGVVEAAGEGFDTARTSVSYGLRAGVHIEVLAVIDPTAATSINLSGNELGQMISGNRGANVITGGGGADRLVGGDGADQFRYQALSDSTVAASDIIVDFSSGSDRIDLSALDAATGTAANEAFSFIGTGAFSGVSGELRFEVVDGGVQVEADVNGDRIADLQIMLAGGSTVTISDFVL